ncbi:hypothetical protein [Escherichia sp. MOD1-EC6147]|uniref:hypothetical protein n=1 Tax=Escherichia sp. MOD1-EC6147 TaxID=2093888 RepID=UPI000CF7A3BE|nr:hypothetical protein [Escherichia sp. MOD1-EC6147]
MLNFFKNFFSMKNTALIAAISLSFTGGVQAKLLGAVVPDNKENTLSGSRITLDVPAFIMSGSVITANLSASWSSGFGGTFRMVPGYEKCERPNNKPSVANVYIFPETIKTDYFEMKRLGSDVIVSYKDSLNDCYKYESEEGKWGGGWTLGTGETVKQQYRVTILKQSGSVNVPISIPFGVLRTELPEEGGRLVAQRYPGWLGKMTADVRTEIKTWCSLGDDSVLIDHGNISADKVNGNIKKASLSVRCEGSSGTVSFKWQDALSGADEIIFDYPLNGLKGRLSVNSGAHHIPENTTIVFDVESTLIAEKEITPGKFEVSKVLVVEFS